MRCKTKSKVLCNCIGIVSLKLDIILNEKLFLTDKFKGIDMSFSIDAVLGNAKVWVYMHPVSWATFLQSSHFQTIFHSKEDGSSYACDAHHSGLLRHHGHTMYMVFQNYNYSVFQTFRHSTNMKKSIYITLCMVTTRFYAKQAWNLFKD